MSYEIVISKTEELQLIPFFGLAKTAVFQTMYFLYNGFGQKEFYHSIQSISNKCGVSLSTTKRYVNELVSDGLFRKRIGTDMYSNRITYIDAVVPAVVELLKQAKHWFYKIMKKTASYCNQIWAEIRQGLVDIAYMHTPKNREPAQENQGGGRVKNAEGVGLKTPTKNQVLSRIREKQLNSSDELLVDNLSENINNPDPILSQPTAGLAEEDLTDAYNVPHFYVSTDWLSNKDPKYFPAKLVAPLADGLVCAFKRDQTLIERFLEIGEHTCEWMVWNAAASMRDGKSLEEAVAGTVTLVTNKKYTFTKPRSLIKYERQLVTKGKMSASEQKTMKYLSSMEERTSKNEKLSSSQIKEMIEKAYKECE